jgi:hypothetical protein
MHLRVQLQNGSTWFFTPTYASPNEDNRGLLWEDLKTISNNMNNPWLVAGDLNDIVCSKPET